MDQIFLYQTWMHQQLQAYGPPFRPLLIRGQEVSMPPRQYGAALMQAYLGKASLAWISKQAGIPLRDLKQWRSTPRFLLVMDWSKALFSAFAQEKLILNDYSAEQSHFLSGEISMLEESLRVSLRMPLYQRFARLGRNLISGHQNNITLQDYDLRLYRRLFLFFLALEHHWPSPARRCLDEEFLPLDRDVVWPLLEIKRWVEPKLLSLHQTAPFSRIQRQLGDRLRETLLNFLTARRTSG